MDRILRVIDACDLSPRSRAMQQDLAPANANFQKSKARPEFQHIELSGLNDAEFSFPELSIAFEIIAEQILCVVYTGRYSLFLLLHSPDLWAAQRGLPSE